MATELVGRFAPSPSGRMHLGNAFSALMAWCSVRSQGGSFLLRMEDLDLQRCRPEYAQLLRQDLLWLGLDWDAETQPQSQRTAVYASRFAALAERRLVYPCYCTRNELHAASAPHGTDGQLVYPGTCRQLTPEQRAKKPNAPAWRLRVPEKTMAFTDGLQGAYRENLAKDCGDFILRRSDGVYAYQLAVTTDDALSGVTEVVRGADLLSSTPRQMYLYSLFGETVPAYVHVPLLITAEGRRLSKRDKDTDLGYLQSHTFPQRVVGALAWSVGLLEKPEPLSARELASVFSWQKVRAKPVVIGPEFAANIC